MSEAAEAIVCAHCGAELDSSVYAHCSGCGQPVCEACARDEYCDGGRERKPVEADPAEGAPE